MTQYRNSTKNQVLHPTPFPCSVFFDARAQLLSALAAEHAVETSTSNVCSVHASGNAAGLVQGVCKHG